MCRDHAEAQGYTIVAELAEDDRGASGASLDLDGLNQVRDMAHDGQFDVLVVREIDRFARSLAKQLIVEEELKRGSVEIEYVIGQCADTPEGQLMKHVKASVAEYERLKIGERTMRARRQMVKAGNIMCHGSRPYGYRIAEKDGRRTLEIYEAEAEVVRMIYDLYTADEPMPIRQITLKLTQMGTLTPDESMHAIDDDHPRNDHWNSATVGRILKRELYCGTWHYGKQRPDPETLAVEVPAIVSRELWEKVRRRRARNKHNSRRSVKYEFLLRRRVTCGCCQSSMRSESVKRRGRVSLYYRCHRRYETEKGGDASCTMTTWFPASEVDAATWDWLKGVLSDRDQLLRARREYTGAWDVENEPLRRRLQTVEDLIAQTRPRLERVLDLYVDGRLDKDLLVERRKRLESTLAGLERERATLEASMNSRVPTEKQIRTVFDLAEAVREGMAWADMDFSRRRELIELLDVRATLAVEDDEKVLYLSCQVLGVEGRVGLTSQDSRTLRHDTDEPFVLTARIVLGPVPQRKSA